MGGRVRLVDSFNSIIMVVGRMQSQSARRHCKIRIKRRFRGVSTRSQGVSSRLKASKNLRANDHVAVSNKYNQLQKTMASSTYRSHWALLVNLHTQTFYVFVSICPALCPCVSNASQGVSRTCKFFGERTTTHFERRPIRRAQSRWHT